MKQKIPRNAFDAVLFDMDGVVTDTAEAHSSAWKLLFDDYLGQRAQRGGDEFVPFDERGEYRRYVDGMPRLDGVQSFLASRGIHLPFGNSQDGPDQETICGLGNRKDGFFNEWLRQNRVRTFPGTMEFIQDLRAAGVKVAVFSASRNTERVLKNANVQHLFDAQVDGRQMARLDLPGKPDPAMLLLAAKKLSLPAQRCVIVEDAIAGVQAGARGDFAFVVGINRDDYADELRAHGADLVVSDLSELHFAEVNGLKPKQVNDLDSVWGSRKRLETHLQSRRLAVFLDYDGTLTPIVADYRKAFLPESMRETLSRLARNATVGVISGRDLQDVRKLVGLDTIYYSGSHGFELAGPDGWHHIQKDAAGFLPDLDAAETALRQNLAVIAGHAVERKQFSIAIHYRQVEDSLVADVEATVDAVLAQHAQLRKGHGKKVFELQPRIDWDKGRAVEQLLDMLELADSSAAISIYIGDDLTDEAVFRVLRQPNMSIVISDSDRTTSADYVLKDCQDVESFLAWLADCTGGKVT
ncbi:MAG: trehalose-phosphatase [Gammaproteobacteria bacterium]|nr:trehalose-phosphatase [Gammaproteobacteria bacterium]